MGRKTNIIKIIFTGPVGAGKTTAIESISDSKVLRSEVKASKQIRADKQQTTVAMDYGTLTLKTGQRLHFYGTPGQQRFKFMWPILTRGGQGLVLFIDNARPDPLADLHHFLDAFNPFIQSTQIVIGITRTDISQRLKIKDYQGVLQQRGQSCPIKKVDARCAKEVKNLVNLLRL